jgi:hypothetical protein
MFPYYALQNQRLYCRMRSEKGSVESVYKVRFQGLTAPVMKMAAFWDIAPSGLDGGGIVHL